MKQFYMSKRFWKEIRKVIPKKISIRRPRKGAKKIWIVERTHSHLNN